MLEEKSWVGIQKKGGETIYIYKIKIKTLLDRWRNGGAPSADAGGGLV